MLALGSDSPYQAPARKELEEVSSPQEQIALGDAWWDLAQTREGPERGLLLRHARDWYRRVQPNVTRALDKLKIETRLTEVGKIDRPVGGPSTADGLAIWNAHNHKFKDRGALACNVLLRRGQITVWEKRNVRLKWGNTVDPVTLVQLPKVPFDTLRVEITQWYWVRGERSFSRCSRAKKGPGLINGIMGQQRGVGRRVTVGQFLLLSAWTQFINLHQPRT